VSRMILIQRVEFLAGTSLQEAVREAYEYACRNRCIVQFNFNGVEMSVSWVSEVEEKIDYWEKKISQIV